MGREQLLLRSISTKPSGQEILAISDACENEKDRLGLQVLIGTTCSQDLIEAIRIDRQRRGISAEGIEELAEPIQDTWSLVIKTAVISSAQSALV